jgi:hypothetical protein
MAWIRLWQGRRSPILGSVHRGVKGPIFGPFLTIHENTDRDIRCGEVWRLLIANGFVFYGGMYYERWSVFSGPIRDCDQDYVSHFCPDLATPPAWTSATAFRIRSVW